MNTFSWRKRTLLALLAAVALPAVASAQRGGAPVGPQAAATPEPARFRYMGPAPAGRIASVSGVPGDPDTYYLGSASGGVWKSTDGGTSFKPIFDDQPVAAIGSIAVADTDPNTVWVGTGEPWVIRYSDVMGDGVYVSKDAGATWKHMGLVETGRIARVLIHPKDANTVYVCAEGRLTGPQEERGVFKTTDGGATWKRVLFVDQKTGCSGLAIDQHDPNTLLAGTWQVEEHTWAELSGGPGSGVYITHDGGEKWTKIANGMPKSPVGKVDVQIAASDPKRMYALIQTADQGSLWRSDDAGTSWKTVSWDRSLIGRAGYYIRMMVNPQNADDVFISSSSFHRSVDGGKSFSGNGGQVAGVPQGASCGDCHDIWIDPKDPVRYALTDDGGANINTHNGPVRVSLPNGQMYHVHIDNRVPYWIYSNRQDDGTMRGPSTVSEQTGSGCLPEGSTMPSAPPGGFGGRGGRGGGRGAAPNAPQPGRGAAPGNRCGSADENASANAFGGFGGGGGGRGRGAALAWQPGIGGCESGFTIPDPTNADVVYASCYGNKVTRWDAKMGTARSIEPWEISLDSPPNEAKYRCHWTAPMAIDPFDTKNVLYGCQLILKTSNGGQSWTEFSPDLSTKDPAHVVSNGGLVGDNLGQFNGEVVWDIEYSKIRQGLIWAGTNDGKLWYTRDSGAHWTDVSKNFKDLPPWGTYAQIWPSTFDAGAAYVAVDFHLMDDRKPYIYKTTDYGATWTKINGNIPTGHPLDYILSLSGNPNKKGMLFAGSAHGFYYSMDDGGTWTQFKEGLPPAPVSWINVEPRFHDVAISTYGRGLYILPNITMLEQTGAATPPTGTVTLYDPAPIVRLARDAFQQAGRQHFTLSLPTAPSTPIKMEILTAAGKVYRTEQIAAHQGLNGVNWDLRLDPPTLVALRTTPPENPHIWEEPRFQNTDVRRITHWGITPQTGIPMAAPGKYQVRFTVDGKEYTKPFEVIKDPAVEASDADLQLSTATQIQIRDAITQTSKMVNQMEVWRKQIEDQVKANQGKADLVKQLEAMNKKILDVELQLVSRSEMLSDDKYFPEAYKAYMNLIWLSGGVGQGASDEAGSIDYKPTDTQLQVFTHIQGEVEKAEGGYFQLLRTEIPAFNKAMVGKVPPITDTPGGGK
ncbi:MAG TPA: hypothetical protein VL225_19925 [Vicinamibacterales bacterium]|nr:hypothetical protein [Vicinamibacterales bacterium]